VKGIAALLGDTGTLFAELPPEATSYFAALAQRHGLSPALERVMRLIPPSQITEPGLARLLSADRFDVISTGTSHIHTTNALPDDSVIKVPAISVLVRGRPRGFSADTPAGTDVWRDPTLALKALPALTRCLPTTP
jgi:hypothetical protein